MARTAGPATICARVIVEVGDRRLQLLLTNLYLYCFRQIKEKRGSLALLIFGTGPSPKTVMTLLLVSLYQRIGW